VLRPPGSASGRLTSAVLGFVLVMTMTMGAFQVIALAIVADDLTDDLGMTALLFGAVATANTVVGALFAPRSGRVTDLIGPKPSVVLVMVIASIGMFITAAANSAWILFVSCAFSGLCQGWCNPATNKLIAERVPPGNRGTLTGIKQSGVQLGGFLAGATLPTIASASSWRTGLVVYAIAAAATAVIALVFLGPDGPRDTGSTAEQTRAQDGALPRAIWLLTIYALLMGTVVGGTGRFLPLFAENQLGMSNFAAGMVSALLGGLAIATRILWGGLSESQVRPSLALAIQAALAACALGLMLLAVPIGSGMLWVMAAVGSLGLNSWNSVAMLAVITGVPTALAGRASGVVVFGFMTGLSIGGVFPGLIEELTGRYDLAWATLLVLALVSSVLATGNKELGRIEESPSNG